MWSGRPFPSGRRACPSRTPPCWSACPRYWRSPSASCWAPPLPPESSTDQVAEQLARINEQLAQKNRRARRIWQVVVGILLAFVLLWGILCLLSYHSYTQYVSPPKIQVEPLSSIPVERRCSDAVA